MSYMPRGPVVRWTTVALLGCAPFLALGRVPVLKAAGAIPDPCQLITEAEVEQIAGPLKGAPKKGDAAAGEISCEFAPVKGPSFISIILHDGQLKDWKTRNADKTAVMVREFGADAFMNLDFYGSTELYAKKGNFILRINLSKGPMAVEIAKAVARKALPRL